MIYNVFTSQHAKLQSQSGSATPISYCVFCIWTCGLKRRLVHNNDARM